MLGVVFALGTWSGCYVPEAYHCDADSMCIDGDRPGRCELGVGYCSYPDDRCESGREYGPFAGGRAEACVATPYQAAPVLALCLGEGQPSEGQGSCAALNGIDRLDVDGRDSDAEGEVRNAAFLRFALPDEVRAFGPSNVSLVLVVADTEESVSEASGAVWQVEPFDDATVRSAEPERLSTALAQDLGEVLIGESVRWDFELDLSSLSGDLYLGVFPSAVDNVQYWNLLGEVPPQIVISPR